MTAPGDLALIFVLVSLFVASCGYAAGRLHQRYQLRQDREEAYRDGYETASSRVFSLATRIAAPKRAARAARGAAAVKAATPVEAVVAAASDNAPAHFANPGRAFRHQGVTPQDAALDSPAAGESFGFPAPAPPPPNTVAEPAAVGGVNYQPLRDPRPADGSGPVLGRRDEPADPDGRASADPGGQASVGQGGASVRPGGTSVGSGGTSVRPGGASVGLGLGGASVRPGGEALGDSGGQASVHSGGKAAADSEDEASADSGGRHTVPDALVQAATYRLPADRVFRAKVPNSTPLPEQTTTHLSVPKPRRRTDDNVVPPS